MVRASVLGAVALVALAGCGPKTGGNAAANAAANTAAAAPAVDTVITAAELPKFRAGKWQEIETDNGGLPQNDTSCENGSPLDLSNFGEGCGSEVVKRLAAGGYSLDISCAKEASMKTMHLTMKGDFNSAFDIDAVVNTTEPGKATSVETHHLHATYLGACDTPSADTNAPG